MLESWNGGLDSFAVVVVGIGVGVGVRRRRVLWNTSGGEGGADCGDGEVAAEEVVVVAVGNAEEREAGGVGFEEGDD